MESNQGSIWTQSAPGAEYPALEGDLEVDVAIVGGGITGLTAAHLLAHEGKKVALLEARRLAEGVSGHTTAHLTEALDTRYFELIKSFGLDGARLAREAQREAIETIAAIATRLRIDCDFERLDGWLFSEDDAGAEEIGKEVEACSKIGLAVTDQQPVPLPFPVRRAARFPSQAQMHPRRYLLGIGATLQGAGVALYEQTRVLEISGGEPYQLRTENGTVRARDVLLATHSPITRFALQTKLYPYRSYVVGAHVAVGEVRGLFWDTLDPYHYVRAAKIDGQSVILVGGEDHKVGHLEDTWKPFATLERWSRDRWRLGPTTQLWSAQVFETPDGLPYIGKLRGRLYVATGFAGNGMTWGTTAAVLSSQLILGRPSPWAALFDPSRMKVSGARELLSENVEVAYDFFRDRLEKPPKRDPASLLPGEGSIVVDDGYKAAVYRELSGELVSLSPVCTHLGCHVRWNDAEKSWDCPCHGSRYEATGDVIDGPATHGLEPSEAGVPEELEEEEEALEEGEEQGPEP